MVNGSGAVSDDDGHAMISPVNAVAPVIWLLAGLVFGIECVLTLGEAGIVGGPRAVGWRLGLLSDYGFSPAVWDYTVQGRWAPEISRRYVGYLFVHGSFTDALFGAVLLLALGKFVAEVFHWAAVLAVFFGAGIVGAVAFGVVLDGTVPLIGVWPAVYGLIGAFTYITWRQLGARGGSQLSAFRLIAFLLALQLVFAVIFSGGGNFWFRLSLAVPEMAGFFAGLAVSPFLAPGGWAAFVARARQPRN